MDEKVKQELDEAFAELPEGVDLEPRTTIGPFFHGVSAYLNGDEACPYDDPLMVDKWQYGYETAKHTQQTDFPEPDDPVKRALWGKYYRALVDFYTGICVAMDGGTVHPNASDVWRQGYETGKRGTVREIVHGAMSDIEGLDSQYLLDG